MQYSKKEYEEFMDYKRIKSTEELPSSLEDTGKTTLPDPVSEVPPCYVVKVRPTVCSKPITCLLLPQQPLKAPRNQAP